MADGHVNLALCGMSSYSGCYSLQYYKKKNTQGKPEVNEVDG